MTAARWGMLAVVALLILAALGTTAADMQPSALRVTVTAVVGLLAPLFWPGITATPARTVLRIVTWSAAATGLAAVILRFLGTPAQPFDRILGVCGMLMIILLLTHAVAAVLERRWGDRSGDARSAREMAGRTVTISLALLGALPLWLGPVGELASRRHDWAIDAVIGLSPLTHLAVAGGNDLLRNQWFYQHSNLAGLQFSYPGLAGVSWFYAAALLALALVALALAVRGRPRLVADATRPDPTKEKPR